MVRSESIGGQTGASAFYWDLSLVKNEAVASHGKDTDRVTRAENCSHTNFTLIFLCFVFILYRKCQTLSEESLLRWMGICFRWAYVIFSQLWNWRLSLSLKKNLYILGSGIPVYFKVMYYSRRMVFFVCSTRSLMGQQTTMQPLPRWTFRGRSPRVYESGGRSRRHALKL